RQGDDRRPVLVVVEDGDVQLLAQPLLDLEAARRRDVLEVDAAEDRGDRLHRGDDLVRVLRREADGEGVDAAELLEEHRLPLHHRQRGLGPDVAQPEHRGAVADDGDRVLLDRQVPRLGRLLGDCERDPRHARRVGHREVVASLQRRLERDLDLAAQMHEEGTVGDVQDLDARDPAHRGGDLLHVPGVACEHGDVADLGSTLDLDQVDRAEETARVADRLGQPPERSGAVLQADAQRGAERRGRVDVGHAGAPISAGAWTSSSKRTGKSTELATRQPSSAASAASRTSFSKPASVSTAARTTTSVKPKGPSLRVVTCPLASISRLRSGIPRRSATATSVTAKHEATDATSRSSGLHTPSMPPLNSGGVATSRSSLPGTETTVRRPESQRTPTGKSY